jgi:hypothetical protein
MSTSSSVTHWIVVLRNGDRADARPLWDRYFRLPAGRTRRRLAGPARRADDEETEGYSLGESAARMGHAPRAVRWRLRLIRHTWEREVRR